MVVHCFLTLLKIKKENKERNSGERGKKLATIGINNRPVTDVVTNHVIMFIQYLKAITMYSFL